VSSRSFTEEDAAFVRTRSAELEAEFAPFFAARRALFPRWRRLMDCLARARDEVLEYGWSHRQHFEEAHNEVCVALSVLDNPRSRVRHLNYEPSLRGTRKTIDFRVEVDGRIPCYLDVKTIAPKSVDRWNQFDAFRTKGRIGTPSRLALDKEWLGGELWHAWFAARARMLEYTLELEEKAVAGGLLEENVGAVLMLCSNGFDWHGDALEDFVAFYVHGLHRFDDPFAEIEQHFVEMQRLELPRRLRRFAYLERPADAVRPGLVRWNVTSPRLDPAALVHG
jgi:hypothetical protein